MNRADFEALVDEAVENLPEAFRERMENLAIVVEDWADPATCREAGVRHRSELLGLYHGVPLTQRTHGYGLVAPDKISIYRQPILMQCRGDDEVRALVHRVVRHEVAHYFGIDDARLDELNAY